MGLLRRFCDFLCGFCADSQGRARPMSCSFRHSYFCRCWPQTFKNLEIPLRGESGSFRLAWVPCHPKPRSSESPALTACPISDRHSDLKSPFRSAFSRLRSRSSDSPAFSEARPLHCADFSAGKTLYSRPRAPCDSSPVSQRMVFRCFSLCVVPSLSPSLACFQPRAGRGDLPRTPSTGRLASQAFP